MSKIFLFLIMSFWTYNVQSQYLPTSSETATKIKSLVLLVGFEQENPELLRLYKDEPENLKVYKDGVIGKNFALKNAVENYWHYTKEKKYLPLKEAKALMKQEKDKYVLISFDDTWGTDLLHTPDKLQGGWTHNDGKLGYNERSRYNLNNIRINTVMIGLPRKVYEVFLPTVYPTEGDLIYAIQKIQHSLDFLSSTGKSMDKYYSETNKRADELQGMTLLINGKEINHDLTEEILKQNYPFPYKISDYAAIEKALKTKDSTVAIITIARFDPQNSEYVVTNAGTGKLYFFKSYYTYEHGEQHGTISIMVRPYGLTVGIISGIAAEAK
jgi:hypothetical protein